MEFKIRYTETYFKVYDVEADSFEKAEAKLRRDIYEGRENGPEECCDSSCELIIETEAVEMCPYCGSENVYSNWNANKQGYIATCQHCGKDIFLCDECFHANDNPKMQCDWHEEGNYGICFRGKTIC